MKINFIVQVPNPQEQTQAQKSLCAQLLELVNSRAKSSKSAQSFKGEINLYLLIKETRKSEFVTQICDGLYIGFDEAFSSSVDGNAFTTIMKNAIKSNLIIPESERDCIIFFSKDKVDFDSFFKSEQKQPIVYKAIDPEFTLDEVIMSPKERVAVMRAVTLIKDKDLIYRKWNFRKVDKREKSILCFHGVPGTGKSMCAHGVASYLGKKILIGSYAQIESEFVGVGAKNLVALFNAAQEQDAVLFIDEADTFLSRRLPASNDSSKHYNSMSNELYTLIENFNGCIVFASNHIKDFDPAVISRIIEPIEFKLPDLDARKTILSHMLQSEFPIKGGKTDAVLAQLAAATEGFSGRDLRKAIQIAHAAIVWKYKYELGVPEDEIEASIDDIIECIQEVKEAKEKISARSRSKTGNLLADFQEIDSKNTRIIQLAAHALLADGVIDANERELFSQLEKKLNVSCALDVELIPSVEKICSGVLDNAEKASLLEVVCRMSAIDGNIDASELALLKQVCDSLSVEESVYDSLQGYAERLAADYKSWREIVASLGTSDSEILSKLKEEYNEGAAYYRLSQFYRNGSQLFGGIEVNEKKADKYEKMASKLGYRR